MTNPVIEVTGLKKRFVKSPVLREISLSITAGFHTGLVGNNGEGKTTLFRLMLGLLRPDAGEIRINGEIADFPRNRAQKLKFGYLPESISFYPTMTGRRNLQFLTRLKGVSAEEIEPLLQLVGLAEAAAQQVKTYSKGMRQRLGLAQALLGKPQMLFLDEPTNGLDPDGIRIFYDLVKTLQAREVAIFTASHQLAELEPRLDYLYLLKDGRLQKSGTVKSLIGEANLPVLVNVGLKDTRKLPKALLERLGARPSPNGHSNSYEIHCNDEAKLEVLSELIQHRKQLIFLSIKEPGLEEIFHYFNSAAGAGTLDGMPGGEGSI